MITYTIEPKQEPPIVEVPRLSLVQRIVGAFTPPATPTPRPLNGLVDLDWTKVQYAIWIGNVMHNFKVGDLVTLYHVPIQVDHAPFYYVISYINEYHRDVKYDIDVKQPVCLVLRSKEGILVSKCPAVLRKLTPKEVELVNLSNMPVGGTA